MSNFRKEKCVKCNKEIINLDENEVCIWCNLKNDQTLVKKITRKL